MGGFSFSVSVHLKAIFVSKNILSNVQWPWPNVHTSLSMCTANLFPLSMFHATSYSHAGSTAAGKLAAHHMLCHFWHVTPGCGGTKVCVAVVKQVCLSGVWNQLSLSCRLIERIRAASHKQSCGLCCTSLEAVSAATTSAQGGTARHTMQAAPLRGVAS